MRALHKQLTRFELQIYKCKIALKANHFVIKRSRKIPKFLLRHCEIPPADLKVFLYQLYVFKYFCFYFAVKFGVVYLKRGKNPKGILKGRN